MRRRVILAALVFLVVVWNAALVAAPHATPRALSVATYAAGSLICHQRPERSFHSDGAQYPVCARCLGLYLGGLAGVVAWCLVSGMGSTASLRARRLVQADTVRVLLMVVAVPTLISVGLGMLGVWESNNIVRAVIALPLGAVIAAVIAAVFTGDLR